MAARLTLPYAHLNLRRNPFGELPPEERTALAVVDLEHFREPLESPGFALQLLGESGRGKTTHLLGLRRYFPDAPYVRIQEHEAPRIPWAPLLLLDELQHLPRPARAVLFRREASFAIGTHADLGDELDRAGVAFETVVLRGLDLERLRAIVARRIEAARRGPGPLPRVSDPALITLLQRHGDDVRAMEGELYDLFERLEGVGDGEV